MRRKVFKHQFVELVPDELEEGVLYVTIAYGTAVHLCACGCGSEVVTPLSPAQWKFTYDGEAITLSPSIGNLRFSCQSHYFIVGDKVIWGEHISEKDIEAVKSRDRNLLKTYFEQKEARNNSESKMPEKPKLTKRLWGRLWKNLFG